MEGGQKGERCSSVIEEGWIKITRGGEESVEEEWKDEGEGRG